MTLNPDLINLGIPLAVCVLSALPFIFIPELSKKEDKTEAPSYYAVISYLLFLGLGILVFIIYKSIGIMSFNNGNRTLFICSVLLIACLDRIIDLYAYKVTIKATLISRLHYFVILLSSVPIIWQLLIHIIPPEISGKSRIMNTTEILLMFIMLALGMINRPNKKKTDEQNRQESQPQQSA